MRPQNLTPLFASLRALSGVGPRIQSLFDRLLARGGEGDARIIDLLWHFPTGVVDRRARPKVTDVKAGQIVTLDLTVLKHLPSPAGSPRPYRITCEDDTGAIDLVYFRGERKFLERQLPVGERRIVSGRIETYSGMNQMPHPDYVVPPDAIDKLPLIEPVYPLTAGLTGKTVQRAATQALAKLPDMPEWQEPEWLRQQEWEPFTRSLKNLHAPATDKALPGMDTGARQRLAYDELLASQLALALVRRRLRKPVGRPLAPAGLLRERIIAGLPFDLTGSQVKALGEIDADLSSQTRMVRLLQGDVGSGKTLIALLTMARAVETGAQAALMAPTEVLARQHLRTIAPIAERAGFKVAILTGREKGKERESVLASLASGEMGLLVGTHALFQEGVDFKDLAVVVIDEQHRFGVHQRLALQAKGDKPTHLLVMTATPIPRTLLLTHYGDMDVSQLTEKPAGRQPIATRALPLDRMNDVLDRLDSAMQSGAQAYWVCPLVEESEVVDAAAAEERYRLLGMRFDKVGLVHGRLAGRRKDQVMRAFAAGELSLLVATTVIEVGVDVPNATIMVIEHAERFGLAQLHQLRGRVGRGTGASSCILLYQEPLGQVAKARLRIMRESDDGFRIAEEDLRLRGGGELLGVRQSGEPGFRIATLPGDEALLAAARDDAKLILARDPELTSERGQALRTLLYLFERDEAVKLLRAG